jgi:hypothetical protein
MQQAEVPTTTTATAAATTPAVASTQTSNPLFVFESAKGAKAKLTPVGGTKNRRGRPPLRRTVERNSQPKTSSNQGNMALNILTSQQSTRVTTTDESITPWSDPDKILRKKRKRPQIEEETISNNIALIIRDDELPDETPPSRESDITILV